MTESSLHEYIPALLFPCILAPLLFFSNFLIEKRTLIAQTTSSTESECRVVGVGGWGGGTESVAFFSPSYDSCWPMPSLQWPEKAR